MLSEYSEWGLNKWVRITLGSEEKQPSNDWEGTPQTPRAGLQTPLGLGWFSHPAVYPSYPLGWP